MPPGMWELDSATQISPKLSSVTTWQGNTGGTTINGGTAIADTLTLQANMTGSPQTARIELGMINVLNSSFTYPSAERSSNYFAVMHGPTVSDIDNSNPSVGYASVTPTYQYTVAQNWGLLPKTALSFRPKFQSAGTLGSGTETGTLVSLWCRPAFDGSQGPRTLGNFHAVFSQPEMAGTAGSVTNMNAFVTQPVTIAGTTATTIRGYYFSDAGVVAATATNVIAIDIDSLAKGGTLNATLRSTTAGVMLHQGNAMFGSGSATPTNLLSLEGNSARTIAMERHTTANTTGNNLIVQAGGATSGATDKPSGLLALRPGISTGKGTAVILIQGLSVATATATADNSIINRQIIGGMRVLQNNTTMTIATMTIGSTTMVGAVMRYSVEVVGRNNTQIETGMVTFNARSAGTVVSAATPTKFGNQQNLSAGTLTVTFQQSSAATSELYLNANSNVTEIVPGYPRITYTVDNLTHQAMAIITGT